MQKLHKRLNGVYLVVDPKPGVAIILPKVKQALDGGVDIIQLWNHWNDREEQKDLINEICALAHRYNVPVLINECWERLVDSPLDGIHFDSIPANWNEIKNTITRPFIAGITCGNDFAPVEWAMENKLDYISFCSMFPSPTANSCERVDPAIIKRARSTSNIAIFVAGGITQENIPSLLPLGINGVAVVSGILKATDPRTSAQTFKQSLIKKNQ